MVTAPLAPSSPVDLFVNDHCKRKSPSEDEAA